MKKLTSLVLVFLTSMFSLTSWAADRVAPTSPEPQTLESGHTYFLYNVGSGKFIYRSDNYVKASATSKTGIIITDKGDGTYTMQFSDNNSYIWTSSSDLKTQSGVDSDVYFRIAEVEGGYTIQRNKNYDATNYVGNNNSDYVYANLTSGNIVWQLFDDAGLEVFLHYKAKKALYDALESASGYSPLIENYDEIYENESSTTEDLSTAATELANYVSWSNAVAKHSLHDNPILLVGNGWSIGASTTSDKNLISQKTGKGKTIEIKGVVDLATESTIYYKIYGYSDLQVFIDGNLVRSLDWKRINNTYYYGYRDYITAGKHEIVWKFTGTETGDVQFQQIGVISTPQISVNLLEAGSLGTEALYNVNHIKDVRNLKVTGKMNSSDWAKIEMMTNLFLLDLEDAEITEIPTSAFAKEYNSIGSYTRKSNADNLYSIKLPKTLKSIGSAAFANSVADDFVIPSTVTSIGKGAFSGSRIRVANLSGINQIPDYTFQGCPLLEDITLSDNLNEVGKDAFSGCSSIKEKKIILPNTLTIVKDYAFYNCANLNFRFPDKYLTIYDNAFYGTGIDSLILHQSWSTVNGSWSPFRGMKKLVYAELPTVVAHMNAYNMLSDCPNLKKIVLKSPTKVSVSEADLGLSNITLVVPSYLINAYKLDNFWYNAKSIEGFDYSSIDFIPLNGNLTLNQERFGGQPSIEISSGYYLKINGENEQKFNNIKVNVSGYSSSKGQLLNNCENITATGENYVSYGSEAKEWYFISLPFDLDVSRITPDDGVQYAIRYYDGAGRAANGKSGNWKNVDRTGIIPAGTGFIFQTNNSSWTWFYAADTENKYGTLRTTEFNKTLAVNASETTSNKGWNLVGNPYQCYYNNHCLNFTAPITVWNGSTYVAYSLTDDDYAIRPNEAFFVQCPNEEYTTIGFPLQGRQLTSVIESQNAVKEWAPQAKTRQVVNITVAGGETEDMTRVVLNEEASMAYETSCDASKFMSMDGSVPQIYTLDAEGTQYAINERPVGDGNVALGFYAGTDGSYTVSVTRCDAERVFLTDNLTGETADITNSAYTFSAKAGTDNTRFTLSFIYNDPTAIQNVEKVNNEKGERDVYDLSGRKVNGQSMKGIYIIRQGKKTDKVIIR